VDQRSSSSNRYAFKCNIKWRPLHLEWGLTKQMFDLSFIIPFLAHSKGITKKRGELVETGGNRSAFFSTRSMIPGGSSL
jgi:hypothetical protein